MPNEVHFIVLGLGLAALAHLRCVDSSIILGRHHGPYSIVKAERITEVGIDAVHPICDPLVTECISSDEEVQDELRTTLEADGHTNVTSSIGLGQLMCDSLPDAPGSSLLRFAITSNQTVVAARTSFSVVDGVAFSDNQDRMVWMGDIVYPRPALDSAPSTISMTWTDSCDVDSFLLKMMTQKPDGTAEIVTSVPCGAGLAHEICMVELDVEFQDAVGPVVDTIEPEEDDIGVVEGAGKAKDVSLSSKYLLASAEKQGLYHDQGLRRLDGDGVITPSGRRLETSTQVDLLVLYTPEAMRQVAASTSAQMETVVAAAFASTNEAMTNSEISLDINVVHVQPAPYSVDVTTAEETLKTLRDNEQVKELRSTHRADLVTLLAQLTDMCGLGYLFPVPERSGFSVSRPNCFFQYTQSHELAHNLGCSHNREEYDDAEDMHDYAHGLRYCDGEEPYRTIMSYSCPSAAGSWTSATVTKGNHFSNPDVFYLGKPTGTETENCARAINENKVTVSNFRVKTCMGPDGPCSSTSECCTGTCVDWKCGLEMCTELLDGYSANGYCGASLNTKECGFDGGDCCECDCIPERANECGVNGYDCLDPNSRCFSGGSLVAYSTGDAGISGATSATTPLKICAAELDACSSERECRSCLKIDASATCKRDTLVDSSHCDGVSEVVCCILENDARCAANAKLRAAIGCLEGICPAGLACIDGS